MTRKRSGLERRRARWFVGALVVLMIAVGAIATVLGWFPAGGPWFRAG